MSIYRECRRCRRQQSHLDLTFLWLRSSGPWWTAWTTPVWTNRSVTRFSETAGFSATSSGDRSEHPGFPSDHFTTLSHGEKRRLERRDAACFWVRCFLGSYLMAHPIQCGVVSGVTDLDPSRFDVDPLDPGGSTNNIFDAWQIYAAWRKGKIYRV